MNKAELKPLFLPFSQHTGTFSTHSFVSGGTRGDLEGSFWFQICKHDFYYGIPQIRKSCCYPRSNCCCCLNLLWLRRSPGCGAAVAPLLRGVTGVTGFTGLTGVTGVACSSPVQRDVPHAPAGPLHPAGGALHRPDGVVDRPVHPPRLRGGDLAVCQVSSAHSLASVTVCWRSSVSRHF